MLVVVDSLGEAEVLAVEGRGGLAVAHRQGHVVQTHTAIIAAGRPM